ncbi:MAG: GAF domain-containing protein [Paracoccaceae bacterium]
MADAPAVLDGAEPVPATAAPRRDAFVRATEVWVPDAADERLTLSSGAYGELDAFGAVARETSFAKGEGLPGRAWAEGRPIVLDGFRGSYFRRTDAAEAAGLTAAVALPVFDGLRLKGVLVLFCAGGDRLMGAIEVWCAGSGEPGAVMTLEAGYFGAAEHFGWVSRHTQFPRGSGLPGTVWETGLATLFRDLGASHRFVRADSAGRAGLTTGLGLPVQTPSLEPRVLTLLSARGAPIARRFELWSREGDDAFALAAGTTEDGPVAGRAARVEAGQGPIGRVIVTRAPLAAERPEGGAPLVAVPVFRAGRLVQIAAWYL